MITHLPSLRPPSRARIPFFLSCAKSFSMVLSETVNFSEVFSEVFSEIFSEIAFADKNGLAEIISIITFWRSDNSFTTSFTTSLFRMTCSFMKYGWHGMSIRK